MSSEFFDAPLKKERMESKSERFKLFRKLPTGYRIAMEINIIRKFSTQYQCLKGVPE
jgi:hypothetical protein